MGCHFRHASKYIAMSRSRLPLLLVQVLHPPKRLTPGILKFSIPSWEKVWFIATWISLKIRDFPGSPLLLYLFFGGILFIVGDYWELCSRWLWVLVGTTWFESEPLEPLIYFGNYQIAWDVWFSFFWIYNWFSILMFYFSTWDVFRIWRSENLNFRYTPPKKRMAGAWTW